MRGGGGRESERSMQKLLQGVLFLGFMGTYGLLSLKLTLGGLWSSICSTPTVVRMCPPLTTKNWLYYAPLVAVGTSNGSVLIFNLFKRIMYKEIAIHSCCVQ